MNDMPAVKPLHLPALNVDKNPSNPGSEKKKARKAKLEKIRQDKHATAIQARWRGAKAREEKSNIEKKPENSSKEIHEMGPVGIAHATDPDQSSSKENGLGPESAMTEEAPVGGILPPDKPEGVVEWPEAAHDDYEAPLEGDGKWPNLDTDDNDSVLQWVMAKKKVLVRAVTWNMEAKKPPAVEEVQQLLLPLNRFHIVAIGTEECERSIAKSAMNPSKKVWEAYLREAVGKHYRPIKAHTLQAIHMMVFVHKAVCPLVTDVHSAAVACGMANKLGNKGGIGLSIKVADTRMVFVNTHLAAHQHDVSGRNAQVAKLFVELPYLLMKKSTSTEWDEPVQTGGSVAEAAQMDPDASEIDEPNMLKARGGAEAEGTYDDDNDHVDSDDDEEVVYRELRKSVRGPAMNRRAMSERTSNGDLTPSLAEYADRLFFMGDMNYRINGNRAIVDRLLAMNMREVLLSNDQLSVSRTAGEFPPALTEAPLLFRPTYKFNHGCDLYDTSSKQRIPSWTDRILYTQKGSRCLAYNSVTDLRSSDHRPVYASFSVDVQVSNTDRKKILESAVSNEFSSESQVCSVM